MSSASDTLLTLPIRFVHEKLHLTPNQISTAGCVAGMAAAGMVAAGFLLPGLTVLAFSQILDALDGGVARRYHLESPTGRILEVVYDRLNELAIFLALVVIGRVTLALALLAFTAIMLVTAVEPLSKFDPGFKRFMIYFGYLATVLLGVKGFQIALHVVFFANLLAFLVGTVLVDYRLQREIDAQAILRRRQEAARGIAQAPDDPPSFLSKLFA